MVVCNLAKVEVRVRVPSFRSKFEDIELVTSRTWLERWLHTWISIMCGRGNTCGKKINYKSQASAEKAAVRVGVKFNRPFDVYRCGFCWGWHIGGSYDLTMGKFFRILWFWIIRKRKNETVERVLD